jgi:hypothetical protein
VTSRAAPPRVPGRPRELLLSALVGALTAAQITRAAPPTIVVRVESPVAPGGARPPPSMAGLDAVFTPRVTTAEASRRGSPGRDPFEPPTLARHALAAVVATGPVEAVEAVEADEDGLDDDPRPIASALTAVVSPHEERRSVGAEAFIEVLGRPIPTSGLDETQRALLRAIAALPSHPTEVIGGVRYLVVGDRRYRDDCSNALRPAFEAVGIDLFSEHVRYPDANGVRLIRHKGGGRRVEAPRIGDLVVFDDTWDRDGDGDLGDRDTHAAVVVDIEASGVVVLYNRVRSGHRLYRMDLADRDRHRGPGGVVHNDFLRARRRGDPEDLPRTTGALFSGWVRVLDA